MIFHKIIINLLEQLGHSHHILLLLIKKKTNKDLIISNVHQIYYELQAKI
jgi:hypothetical protein